MKPAALLAVILLASAPVMAADANRSTEVLTSDSAFLDIAMSPAQRWLVGGTEDGGETSGTGADPDANNFYVWKERNLIGQSGWSQQRVGAVDATDCVRAGVFTDCSSDVIAVSMAHVKSGNEGIRYVLGANNANGNRAMFQYYSTDRAFVDHVQFENEVLVDVELSKDGEWVVLATTVTGQGLDGDTGKVRLFAWGATIPVWVRDLEDPPTSLAVHGEADRILVGAGTLASYSKGGALFSDNIGANPTVTAVAASDHIEQWAVAGFSSGDLNLYSLDGLGTTYERDSNIKPESKSITATAIAPGGQWYAAADADDDLRFFSNRALRLGDPAILDEITLKAPATHLAFSQDGRYLVAGADKVVHFYRATGAGLEEYWADELDGAIADLAVSAEGDLVLVASGTNLFRFEPIDGLTVGGADDLVAIEPGGTAIGTLTFTNDGNRDLTSSFTGTAPSQWGIQFSPRDITVVPGETVSVDVQLAAPLGFAAGSAPIEVVAATSVGARAIPLNVQVLHDRTWSMVPNGTANTGVDAGGTVSFDVRIQNVGNAEDQARVVANITDDAWAFSAPQQSIRLGAGESTLVTVTLTAPSDARELSSATLKLSLDADPLARTQVTATVGARFGVALSSGGPLGSVVAGNTTQATLIVTNLGNAPDSIRIETEGKPSGWEMIFPDGSDPFTVFSLQPEASLEVPVTIIVAKDTEPANYQFRFRATSLGDTGQSQAITLVMGVLEKEDPPKKGKDSPGVPVLLLIGSLAALAAARRRP